MKHQASTKIMLRQMDALLAMVLISVISQDDIFQINLSSRNNSQAVHNRIVWIKPPFVKALDFPELSLCGKAVAERMCDGQTPFCFHDKKY